MTDQCFPKFATHSYVRDPHHPERKICRNCADVIIVDEWAPHPALPEKYITLEGYIDAIVRIEPLPSGHLWQFGKRSGFTDTIDEAKAAVEGLATHFSIPADQRWLSI